mgnify:FL=1
MPKWYSCDKKRLMKKIPLILDNLILIKPKKMSRKIVPFLCPVCKLYMRNKDDMIYYQEYECCSHCAIKWAEGINKNKWINEKWRPSKKELKEYINLRKSIEKEYLKL